MRQKTYFLNKNQEYAITGMAFKPDIVDSDIVKVTAQKRLESLSKRIQELVETKKEPDLNLKIVNTEKKSLTISFKKNLKKIHYTCQRMKKT